MPSVLITGARRGFGRELLDVYAGRGWTVFPLVRQESVARGLESAYAPNCFTIQADVGEEAVIPAIGEVLLRHTASLDLLINNAGTIRKQRGIGRAAAEDLVDHFNIHCVGALRCTKAALPFLTEAARPVIVNVTSRRGSISGTVAGEGALIYSYRIAKAAQNMLTACLAQELAASSIRAFAIHPGALRTAVAPPDADVEPRVAAERLFEWIDELDDDRACACYDLVTGKVIDW